MALWFRVNINFYCTLKNDIALGASASCNIIFLSAIKIDIALTQVPYLYNIALTQVPYLYIIICLLLILCCDWSDHGHMTTLQKWYWGAISFSNTLTQSCQVHVLNSQLQLLKRKPTEVNWDKELRRVWASCKIMIRKGIIKTHF